ncbi:MAG: Xaa-Pro aminopeptidase [Pseudomonadales bacterium]
MSISKKEFSRRRHDLMASMEPDSIAIIPSAPTSRRNGDADYAYRQDSDFYYLSGFAEPSAVLVLLPGREHGETILFCREKDLTRELWDGRIVGPDNAVAEFGADDAFPIGDIDEILPGLIEGRGRVYYAMGRQPDFDSQLMEWINQIRAKARSGAHPPGEFVDLDHLLHELRLIKSAAELKVMRKAGAISAAAHIRAMQICKPGLREYQLEAELQHEFFRNGSRSPAYTSIVGAGDNACILHYIDNVAQISDGDLVLIDAGCELDHYAADITRTFPANGKFSQPQRQLYELVLKAQESAIECIRAGIPWNLPHEKSVEVITSGLVELGLLEGDVEQLIEAEAYKEFYMHRVGHWLGMDVHDVGDYKIGDDWRELEVGMVMTVEPGIYVSPANDRVAARWRGIGIRIEDDVIVTRDGCEVMTNAAPKTVEAIEQLMAGN